MSKHNHKLSDSEFLEILRAHGGLFGETAKAIKNKYKISYSRQAARDRALSHPEILREIEEENVEKAHKSLIELISQKKDLNIRFKAARYYTQTKGKEQFNTLHPQKIEHEYKEQIIKIGKDVLRFLTPWKATK